MVIDESYSVFFDTFSGFLRFSDASLDKLTSFISEDVSKITKRDFFVCELYDKTG